MLPGEDDDIKTETKQKENVHKSLNFAANSSIKSGRIIIQTDEGIHFFLIKSTIKNNSFKTQRNKVLKHS